MTSTRRPAPGSAVAPLVILDTLVPLIVLGTTLALPAAPPEPPTTTGSAAGRRHFVAETAPRFEYSVIFRRDAGRIETRLLLAGASGRFDLLSFQTLDDQSSRESLKDIASGFVLERELRLPGPGAAASVSEGCESDAPVGGCLVFRAGGLRFAAPPLEGGVARSQGEGCDPRRGCGTDPRARASLPTDLRAVRLL